MLRQPHGPLHWEGEQCKVLTRHGRPSQQHSPFSTARHELTQGPASKGHYTIKGLRSQAFKLVVSLTVSQLIRCDTSNKGFSSQPMPHTHLTGRPKGTSQTSNITRHHDHSTQRGLTSLQHVLLLTHTHCAPAAVCAKRSHLHGAFARQEGPLQVL